MVPKKQSIQGPSFPNTGTPLRSNTRFLNIEALFLNTHFVPFFCSVVHWKQYV